MNNRIKIISIIAIAFLGFFIAIACTDSGTRQTSCEGGSGACSSHEGVNCSAGADSDGSVICNDGWRNSSVDFCAVCE